MEGKVSIAAPAGSASGVSITEIRLAAAPPPSGFLAKRGLRLKSEKRQAAPGRLLVTRDALVVVAGEVLGGRLEIPWISIRRAVVDDGSRWGYVAAVCRFPVYAVRSNGAGPGTLIGPLWSRAAALLPARCPVLVVDPVPEQSPNLALIFDPPIDAQPQQNRARQSGTASIVAILLCAEDPAAARAAIGSRIEVGDIDHDDLEYLNRAADLSRSANEASGNGGSGTGASVANGSGNGASSHADERPQAAAGSST
jgi:hypothetical protein